MKNIPTVIYLQLGPQSPDETDDFNELSKDGAVSWCADKIDEHDIEYLREDAVMDVFRWLLGYTDFPINDGAKSPYYWRPELRKKIAEAGIEFKPPQ